MLLCKGAVIHERVLDGSTCLSVAGFHKPVQVKESIQYLLKNWDVTMVLIVCKELRILSELGPDSFLDLKKFIE